MTPWSRPDDPPPRRAARPAHRLGGPVGTVRDADYLHRYTRIGDGRPAEMRSVLVEWPDDEWMGILSNADLIPVEPVPGEGERGAV